MASKRDKQYWARRVKNMEDAILDGRMKDVAYIERQYEQTIQSLETKIRAWYQRLADNNGVSYAEARKLLSKDELKEFHWTVQEYIDRGTGVISGDWAKQLENASAKVHITRLEALETELQAQVEELTGKRIERTTSAVTTAFQDSYYHTAYEVQQMAGVGVSMQKVDKRRLEKVLSRPWTTDDQTFTARCWNDKRKLVNILQNELTRMTATGAKPDHAIETIAKAFNTSKANAGRVVMTESAYMASAAQKECYNDLDVEQYEIVGTLDGHMCDDCGDYDGDHFPMKEFKEGSTAPPFHPWCRCTTVPYYEDMKGIGERWMRDPETGKGGYVPSDMSYKEWKEIYVDKTATIDDWNKKHLKYEPKADIIKEQKTSFIPAGTIKEAEAYAKDTLGIPFVSYAGVDIEVANAMNEAATNAFDYCPEIKSRVNAFGSEQARNKAMKAELEDYYFKRLSQSDDETTAKKWAKDFASKIAGKAGTDELACSWSGEVRGLFVTPEVKEIAKKYSGIGINTKYGGNTTLFKEAIERDVKNGFAPKGTDTFKAIFDHEFGHELEFVLDISEDPKFIDFYYGLEIEEIKTGLSRYAATNVDEFIAEAYAEYRNNPNLNNDSIAYQVGKIIERLVKSR